METTLPGAAQVEQLGESETDNATEKTRRELLRCCTETGRGFFQYRSSKQCLKHLSIPNDSQVFRTRSG